MSSKLKISAILMFSTVLFIIFYYCEYEPANLVKESDIQNIKDGSSTNTQIEHEPSNGEFNTVTKIPLKPSCINIGELDEGEKTVIHGIVYLSDGITPVEGIQIQLQPAGQPVKKYGIEDGCDMIVQDFTDEVGRFILTEVKAGKWSLHAFPNAWIFSSIENIVIKGGEVIVGLQISLPPMSSLQGRLLGEEGYLFKGLQLYLKPIKSAVIKGFYDDYWIDLMLNEEGYFQGRFIPTGKAKLILICDEDRFTPPQRILTYLDLKEGRNTEEVLLGENTPGTIKVYVTCSSSTLEGYFVKVDGGVSIEGYGADGYYVMPCKTSLSAMIDAEGTAVLGPVFPGEWTLTILKSDESTNWKYFHPELIQVESRKEIECVINVEFTKGRIRIIDSATGEPVRRRKLLLNYPDDTMHECKTDDEGWLDLSLGPGKYSVSAYVWNRLNLHQAIVIWTSRGPSQDSIKLKLPDY